MRLKLFRHDRDAAAGAVEMLLHTEHAMMDPMNEWCLSCTFLERHIRVIDAHKDQKATDTEITHLLFVLDTMYTFQSRSECSTPGPMMYYQTHIYTFTSTVQMMREGVIDAFYRNNICKREYVGQTINKKMKQ